MSTRDLVLTALFAAVIVAFGLIPPVTLGPIPVPLTAQSLGVMLAGVILGSKRAASSVLLVLLLCAIGMPVLSGGRGGLAVFASPTAGYLVGFVFAAFSTGYLAERLATPGRSSFIQLLEFFFASVAGGILVDHVCGVAWLCFSLGLGVSKATWATIVFVPGDLLKAVFAAFVGRAVYAGYPQLPYRI
jgi:biotin transport system substrate-specific component